MTLWTEEADVRTAISSSLQEGVFNAEQEEMVASEQLRKETVDDGRCLSRWLKLGAIVILVGFYCLERNVASSNKELVEHCLYFLLSPPHSSLPAKSVELSLLVGGGASQN